MPTKPLTPPKRVRIGHRFYRVKFLPEIESENVLCDGLCVWQPAEILIANYLDPQALAETFLHECLHAMHQESGVVDESTEEQCTTLDAKSLCRLWQDNPAAMRWWIQLVTASRHSSET